MNDISKTDWQALEAMTSEEVHAKALSDPDNRPDTFGKRVILRDDAGATVLERFRKALEREKEISLTVRYDTPEESPRGVVQRSRAE